jgi:hypothetical protein
MGGPVHQAHADGDDSLVASVAALARGGDRCGVVTVAVGWQAADEL